MHFAHGKGDKGDFVFWYDVNNKMIWKRKFRYIYKKWKRTLSSKIMKHGTIVTLIIISKNGRSVSVSCDYGLVIWQPL